MIEENPNIASDGYHAWSTVRLTIELSRSVNSITGTSEQSSSTLGVIPRIGCENLVTYCGGLKELSLIVGV